MTAPTQTLDLFAWQPSAAPESRMRWSERALDDRFAEFCAKNPRIVAEFERRALALIARGRRHFSADAILHSIRFDTAMQEDGAGDGLKLNNNHSSRLARAFASRWPEHADFFELRRLTT